MIRALCRACRIFAFFTPWVLALANASLAQGEGQGALAPRDAIDASDSRDGSAAESCFENQGECDPHSFWTIDAITWNADLVFTNSGVNQHLFNHGAGMELAFSKVLRLPPFVWLEHDEEADFVGTFGFGGQSISGNESTQLVQGPGAVFRLVETEIYWFTFGSGVQGYRDIGQGFVITSWLGCEALVGRTNGQIAAVANNPALESIDITDPIENAFLWGGEIEARVGVVGPRGWALYAGASYDAYRTKAFTGSDHGSTAISGTLAVERRFPR